MFLNQIYLAFILLVICDCMGIILARSARPFPSYLEKCHRNDPELKFCYIKAFNSIKNHLSDGIPEFGLPPMNPLVLPEITLGNSGDFKASFRNVEIFHLDNVVVKDLKVDLDKVMVDLDLIFPTLRIKSHYYINGKLMFLNLNGNGPADGNFTNVEIKAVLLGEKYMKKGKEYVRFHNLKLDEELNKPVFSFDGLFPDPELTLATNKIINENIQDITNEMKPYVHNAVNSTVIGLLTPLFNRFAFKELFPY